jgi:hypothetical protein
MQSRIVRRQFKFQLTPTGQSTFPDQILLETRFGDLASIELRPMAKSPCWRQFGKRVSITRGALAEYLIQLPTPAFGAVHDGKTGSP